MKFVAVVFTLALVVLTLPTTTRAGNTSNFKGTNLEADFSSNDPSGCINTLVLVLVFDNTSQNPPSEVDVSISRIDFCRDMQLIAAFGSIPLADANFQVNGSLNSAKLNATVKVSDFVSGSSFNLSMDLTWTGIGDVFHEITHSRTHLPGLFINAHFNGTTHLAQASGTVSDGTTNFTPNPSFFADIMSVKSGQVQIIK